MLKKGSKVIYKKGSIHHGIGKIPLGAEGIVLKYVENSQTPKVVVDFKNFAKAILPSSCITLID